uniref:peptidylprolyl isomerase n=1 Tax=Hemiscolopendra marginata TaxID=943146 RepID=A0A646QC88_9MYRI
MNAVRSLFAVSVLAIFCDAADDLQIETVFKPESCERQSRDGDLLTMHYTGVLAADGSKFDSSYDSDHPFTFQLGQRHVIAGWDEGLREMCVGEKRKLTVPPHLGYGEAGAGEKIPANAELIFEVELLNISEAPPPANVFKQIDANEDGLLSREEVSDYLGKQVPEEMKEDGKQPFDQDQLVEEIFHHEDKDRNGFISHEEFTGPKHDEL